MLAGSSFAKERVEGVVTATDRRIAWHLSVWMNPMFKAVELPAGISDLNSSLTDVNRNTFALTNKKTAVLAKRSVRGEKVSPLRQLTTCRSDLSSYHENVFFLCYLFKSFLKGRTNKNKKNG